MIIVLFSRITLFLLLKITEKNVLERKLFEYFIHRADDSRSEDPENVK